MRGIRRAVQSSAAALALVAATAGTATAGTAPAATAQPGGLAAGCQPWNGVEHEFADLSAVAMSSSCGAWAVGNEGAETFSQSWNGPDWTPQPTPVSPEEASLLGVASISPKNVWAVGYSSENGQTRHDRTLILHWNGSTWTQVPSPQGDPSHANQLTGVAATSASNVWAVGSYYNGRMRQTLILHWNGHAWTRQRSPDPAGQARFNTLTAVAATSPANAWAVGWTRAVGTIVLHWNGRSWKQVLANDSHFIQLTGVAATSASNAWAIGNEEVITGGTHTVILHWNGHAWRRQRTPDQPGPKFGKILNVLSGVTATSASSAWAVGSYVNGSNDWSTLILHWDGWAWRHIASPSFLQLGPSDVLTGVAAASASSAWAVGGDGIVLHWNGTTWQQ